jgi:hypothetical protein
VSHTLCVYSELELQGFQSKHKGSDWNTYSPGLKKLWFRVHITPIKSVAVYACRFNDNYHRTYWERCKINLIIRWFFDNPKPPRGPDSCGPNIVHCFLLKLLLQFIIIIIITLVVTFLQGIYNYIPKTNYVSTVHSVTVLCLQFVLHIMLFRPRNMFCTFKLLLYDMDVSCHRPFFLVLLLKQRWSPSLRLQASHCSQYFPYYV